MNARGPHRTTSTAITARLEAGDADTTLPEVSAVCHRSYSVTDMQSAPDAHVWRMLMYDAREIRHAWRSYPLGDSGSVVREGQ